jgi:Tol biopolymer transport system component
VAGGEARRVTDVPGGVDQFAWSPDGRSLALAVSDTAPRREGERSNDSFEIGETTI